MVRPTGSSTLRRRTAFFDSYLSALIERDVLELANIERRGDLLKLLGLLAGRTGGLLVPAALANQSGIPRTTLVLYTGQQTLPFGEKSERSRSMPAGTSDRDG